MAQCQITAGRCNKRQLNKLCCARLIQDVEVYAAINLGSRGPPLFQGCQRRQYLPEERRKQHKSSQSLCVD